MPHRVIADEPYTVELPLSDGAALYLRASTGEIEHVTAVHPLVAKTNRMLLLVSTHSALSVQMDFFRESFADGRLEGHEPDLEAAVVDVLAQALLRTLSPA